jgi:G3E family GTPase
MTVANIITGSFGAGKTTAIRWLMSQKPEHELWVVILNEFTDAGIDALSVAESARGSLGVKPTEDFLDAWRSMLRDAALTPRD